jgi:hypothetical protein
LLLCVVIACWIDLGTLHRFHDGDTLLPMLTSLYRWTPFFWHQDRVGMFIPLVAAPFKDPFVNILVQGALNVFSLLAFMFLIARYMIRDASYPVVAGLGIVAFLVLTPAKYRFDCFLHPILGLWLALALGGLVLADPQDGKRLSWRQWTLALALLMLAHWVYIAVMIVLVPLVVFRFWLSPRPGPSPRRGRVVFRLLMANYGGAGVPLRLIVLAFLFGFALMKYIGHKARPPLASTEFGALSPTRWPNTWAMLLERTWEALSPQYWPYSLLAGTALGLIIVLAIPVLRRHSRAALRAATAMIGAGACYAVFLGTRRWMEMNDYHARYLMPSVMLWQGALIAIAVGPICASLSTVTRKWLYVLTVPTLLLAAICSYGFPSAAGVRRDLDGIEINNTPVKAMTEEIVDANVTHVAGSYWTVWPLVFHANLVLHERGEARTIWGVTDRAQATTHLWKVPTKDLCVAVPVGDIEEAEGYLKAFGFPPLEVTEKRFTVWILRPVAAVQPK